MVVVLESIVYDVKFPDAFLELAVLVLVLAEVVLELPLQPPVALVRVVLVLGRPHQLINAVQLRLHPNETVLSLMMLTFLSQALRVTPWT